MGLPLLVGRCKLEHVPADGGRAREHRGRGRRVHRRLQPPRPLLARQLLVKRRPRHVDNVIMLVVRDDAHRMQLAEAAERAALPASRNEDKADDGGERLERGARERATEAPPAAQLPRRRPRPHRKLNIPTEYARKRGERTVEEDRAVLSDGLARADERGDARADGEAVDQDVPRVHPFVDQQPQRRRPIRDKVVDARDVPV
mmetsp:Transcript_8059/g.25464  ORF Transcript_8059/g.25464 Transcript_8059/m.25464 type:complete len:202 (+) Transcript_8059:410-1015(+)